jgi:hypothetical protein
MNQAKKLLNSDILYECGETSFERGRSYFANHQVLGLTVSSEGALFVQLNSAVKGSALSPYKQNIRIIWRPDFSGAGIDGHCSCPVGYNCKHIAAVCLHYQQLMATETVKQMSCLDWLEGFSERQTAVRDNLQEFVAYCLRPRGSMNELTVDFYVTREKKIGGLAKGRRTTLSNIRYSFSYAQYVQTQDSDCAKLLSVLDAIGGQPLLIGAAGYLALTQLLETGHLFWQDIDHPPLRRGTNRELHLHWERLSSDDYRLAVSIDPEATLLLTDPPMYLDIKAAVIGGLSAVNLTSQQLKKLLSAPVVPADQADEFSFRLTVDYPHLQLPVPRKLLLTDLDQVTPVPRLLLFGQQINHQQYIHFIAVAFNYQNWTISSLLADDYSIVKSSDGLVRIKRRLDQEHQAMARLYECGFEHALALEHDMQEVVLYSPAQKYVSDSAACWGNFLETVLPGLKQEGWQVEIDSSFLLQFQTVHHWQAEIGESVNDWFEMRFNIELGGQSLPLLPLIMPVLERYEPASLPETLTFPIGDHQYLTVNSAQIKPVLAILYELFSANPLAQDGSIKLSRFNAASLADLEEQSYGLFSLRGGAELRALGQKLKNFTGIDQVELPVNLQTELRHYQREGLNWLQFLRRYQFAGILADDMGLGKTVQTLAHLLLEKQSGRMAAPSLIIAPTSLMSNWRREMERFTPDLILLILQGTERRQQFDKIKDYDLILTTYPLLPRDQEMLLSHAYYFLILDEAQNIKNPLSKAAQIVRRIKAQHRLSLTGTPMENHLGELWSQFDFLMPGFLGDSAAFKRWYRTPIEVHGDSQQKTRLSKRLAPFLLRRTKQEVATELPPKTERL